MGTTYGSGSPMILYNFVWEWVMEIYVFWVTYNLFEINWFSTPLVKHVSKDINIDYFTLSEVVHTLSN